MSQLPKKPLIAATALIVTAATAYMLLGDDSPSPAVPSSAPADPRSVEWVCRNRPDRVRDLFDNIDLEYTSESTREAVAAGDWPRACTALLGATEGLQEMRPWEVQGDRWGPAGPDNHDVRYAERILRDSVLVDWVWREVPHSDGRIDWDWKSSDGADWGWGLNRHAQFLWLIRAYLFTRDAKYIRYLDEQLRDWILTSPYPGRKSHTARWRGLEVARRAEVWAQVSKYTHPGEIAPSTRILMLSSLVDHADYLRRFHAQGTNWVIGEMTALALIAVEWPVFSGAPEWLEYSTRTMEEQVGQQVYPDGADTELTSHYHHLVANALQNFLNILRRSRNIRGRWGEVPASTRVDSVLSRRVEGMWNYLALTMRPSGFGLQNNDSDVNETARRLEEVAGGYRRYDWTFVAHHGALLDGGAPPRDGPTVVFPWAGHVVMRNGWQRDAQWSFFDIGPWGTAHQHNDKLHVSVSAFGRDLLVDAGRYTYERNEWREYFTGSASHNVILIDGHGQGSDHKRAVEPIPEDDYRIGDDFSFARGTFDAGFDGVRGKATHTRALVYVTGRFWVVVDRIVTDRPRDVTVLWHFHPDCRVELDGDDAVTVDDGKGNLRIAPATGVAWECATISGSESPIQGWYSAKMNHKEESTVATFRARIPGSATFAWILLPVRGEVPPVDARVETAAPFALTVGVGDGSWRVEVPLDGGSARVARMR